MNGSNIFPERTEIAEEIGIRGIGENRLSANDSTIKAYGSSEQCSVWTKLLFGMVGRTNTGICPEKRKID